MSSTASRAVEAGERLHRVLASDLFQTSIANRAFGLLYLNPPYDYDNEEKRSEHAFLMHASRYLADNGVLVFVVPRQRLEVSARYLSSHYRQLRCWAFPDPEREAFDQVVLIGRHQTEPHTDVHTEMRVREWAAGSLDVLPASPYSEFTIPQLPDGDVLFTTRTVDPIAAASEARRSGLWASAAINDALWPRGDARTRPLMPLRRGHMAMLVAGGLPRQPLPRGGGPPHPRQGPHHQGDGPGRGDRGDRDVAGATAHHRGRPRPRRRRDH